MTEIEQSVNCDVNFLDQYKLRGGRMKPLLSVSQVEIFPMTGFYLIYLITLFYVGIVQ